MHVAHSLRDRLTGWRGAALLFAVAFVAYWLEALAWPLHRGRDSWDYWLYFLQFLDGDPPFSTLMVFRTPLTPLVTGAPMLIGGARLLEIVMGLIYAAAVVGWAWAARPFGRIAAVVTAFLVLAALPYAALFHEVSSDFLAGALLAPWAGFVVRAVVMPSTGAMLGLGLGAAALALTRPANQVVVLVAATAALLAPGSWRVRGGRVGIALAAALLPLAVWAGHNAVRYDDLAVARGKKAWVPFFKVAGWIEPGDGPASRRLATAVERDVLTLPPYQRLGVDVNTYFDGVSNLEILRMIALSDSAFGWSSDYDVLGDASLEAIRRHPRRYIDDVAATLWDFVSQRYAPEPVRRHQPVPAQPPTILVNGRPMPSPEAVSPLVPAARFGFVWCPTDAIERCILRDPSVAFHSPRERERYRELVGRIRDWNAQLPPRDAVSALEGKLSTLSWHAPRTFLWIAVALVAIVVRRPRGWPALLLLIVAGLLVLFVHALSQAPQNAFVLPLVPLFVLTAVAALAGPRTSRVDSS